MNYSKTHQKFSNYLNQPDALTNPEKYLGPNYQDVLNFWIYIDTLSDLEKREIADRYLVLDSDARDSAFDAAWDAAGEVVGFEFRRAAWSAAANVTGIQVFGWATLELIGRHKRNTHLALSLTNFSVTDPIDDALTRLHEYSIAHPDHDTDEIVKRAKEFKAKVL